MEPEQSKSSFDFVTISLRHVPAARRCIWIIILLNLFLAFLLVSPNSIYIRQYPQDIFGFLDGIHRTVSGQIPNRDFSSALGAMVYALPALFVRFGANPLLSLADAQAGLLILNSLVVLYLLRTRLPGLPGLLFGIWVALLLAARMNLGDEMQFVTFAMNYNRYCTVFLSELLIFFIPSKKDDFRTFAIDAVIISMLSLILLYTKITYFAVAVASLALFSVTAWINMRRVIAVILIILIVVVGIESRYGILAGNLSALFMAGHSGGAIRGNIKGNLYLIGRNAAELLVCLMLPIAIIWYTGIRRRLWYVMIFVFVGISSILLVNRNAQLYVLSVPFVLLFIGLDIVGRAEPSSRLMASRGLLHTAILLMFCWYSYPLVLNIGYSFAKSTSDIEPIGKENITKRFLIYWDEFNADPQLLNKLVKGDGAPFDIFERARGSATNRPGMSLSEAEYAIALEDGVKAVRAHCGAEPRILTADQVNPFPAILDLPVGGGMVFISATEMSTNSYLSADQMFENITCLMVPKMPMVYPTRELILKLYQDYIMRNFTVGGETDYWTVYRR